MRVRECTRGHGLCNYMKTKLDALRKAFRKGNQRAPGSDVRERFARSAVHAALHLKREAAGGS